MKYEELQEELSIEYYYMIDLNESVATKTIKLIDLYLKHEKVENERLKALYVRNSLEIYLNYKGEYPIDLSNVIEDIQMFLRFGRWFSSVRKAPEPTNIKKHLEKEKRRNLKSEIANLNEVVRDLKADYEELENKKIGVRSKSFEVPLNENHKSNNDRFYKIMEQQERIKKEIEYNTRLISHLNTLV